MKAVLCWLLLGVFPVLSSAGGNPAASLGIYTTFEHEPSPVVLDSLKEEVELLIAPAGLSLEWRPLSDPRPGESFPDLAVVTFRGTCDLSSLTLQSIHSGALGWTHVSDHQIIPFSEVDCDRTRALVSRGLFRTAPEERDAIFGRAVARVLTHELYHVFTRQFHHTSSGVSQATYSMTELLADDFCFSAADEALLASLPVVQQVRHAAPAPLAGQVLYKRSGCPQCHGSERQGTRQGPALQTSGHRWSAAELLSRLKGKASDMYRRAHNLRAPWPSLAKSRVDSLVAYLNSST